MTWNLESRKLIDSKAVARPAQYLKIQALQSRCDCTSYVVVGFKNVCIPDDKKPFPNSPNNFIPIPVVTDRCEKKCCSITTIPLRICKALTIHKSQGMTIGPNENFEKAVVYLPEKSQNQNNTAGLELVALSRVTSPKNLALGNLSNSLCISDLKKIGKNKTNEKIKTFQTYLDNRSLHCCNKVKEEIRLMDNISPCDDEKTYENGCKCLLSWFNSLQ